MIGTNKKDAQETVDALLADVGASANGASAAAAAVAHAPATPDPGSVEELLRERQPDLVTYTGLAGDRPSRAGAGRAGRPAAGQAHAHRGVAAGSRGRTSIVDTRARLPMTAKQDFTPEEWEQILEGPPSAGMLVITAQRGGMWRETVSMAKTYADARQQHGQSELLDAIVAAKPKLDHTRYHSKEELEERSLTHLRDAVALLEAKATAQELDEYRRFVVNLATRVAGAHEEHGAAVSDAEQKAIDSVAEAVGGA